MRINTENKHNVPKLLLIFGVIFLMFQYGVRVSLTGALNEQLMRHFSLNASGFGSLVGIFFFVYMLMQIPAGIISDRVNTKVILAGAFSLTAAGFAFLVATANFYAAAAAQMIIAIGASFAFVLIFKITNTYFPKDQAAFSASIAIAFGNLGPVIISPSISWLSEVCFWRNVIFAAAFFGIAAAATGYFLINEKKLQKNDAVNTVNNCSVSDSLKIILKNPQFFLVGSFSMLTLGPVTAFCDVWGVPFLKSAYGIGTTQASSQISFAYAGMIFGCPIFAWLANRMKSYQFPMIWGATMLFLLISVIIFFRLHPVLLGAILFSIGLMTTSEFLAFPAAISNCSVEVSATVTGFVNMITMLGCTIMVKSVGVLIDFFSGKNGSAGNFTYSFENYQYAVISIAAATLSAVIAALFIKDNYENGKK